MSYQLNYGQARVKDLQCQTKLQKNGKSEVTDVLVDGRPCKPTPRFWTSLQARFGFSRNIFRYFTHKEVFDRISQVAPNDQMRYCVEQGEDGSGKLLAVTNPASAVVPYDDLVNLLDRYHAEEVSYSNGVVRSRHSPRLGSESTIGGDTCQNRFVLDTPIDGYGRPSICLMLLRLVCTNGMVADSPAFRSEVGIGRGGDRPEFALVRALDGFNNEEGFTALRQRFEAATKSWASVNEVQRAYKMLVRLHHHGHLKGCPVPVSGGDGAEELSEAHKRLPILRSFHDMAGDLSQIYGLGNLDALSVRRQRTLPSKSKVYDLLNFISETATHHATPAGNRSLQGLLGSMISTEYDLEGLADQFTDYRDLFLGSERTAETLAELQQA